MNRLQMIHILFENDKDHLIGTPERTSTKLARALEEQLMKDIFPIIEQYTEGLLSTAEFLSKLDLIANEEINL